MNAYLVWLVLAIVPLLGVDEATITVDTFPPGQKFNPGVVVVLSVEGLPEGVEYKWHQIPHLETDVVSKYTDGSQPVLFFCGTEEGRRAFLLQQAVDGLDPVVRCEFDYGGNGPVPPPPPPPPDRKWNIVIVYESGHLDNMLRGQLEIIASLVFRDRLEEAGHCLLSGGIVDVDRIGDVPPTLVPYLESCEDDPMPRICIAPLEGGGVVMDFPLPETADGVFDLLQGVVE